MAHVFLSYSRKDTDIMHGLRADLRAEGLTVFTDDELPHVSREAWQDAIENEIEAASCVVVILTPSAKESDWVKREIEYANTVGTDIFSLLARGDRPTSVPIRLINANLIDIRGDKHAFSLERLVTAVCRHVGIESRSEQQQREEEERERQAREEARQRAKELTQRRAEQARQQRQGTLRRTIAGVRSVSRYLWRTGAVLGVVVAIGAVLSGVVAAVVYGVPLVQDVLSQTEPPPVAAEVEEALAHEGTVPALEETISDTRLPTDAPTATAAPTTLSTPRLELLQLAFEGVSTNDHWTPFIQDFDGVEMALVPEGCFTMGSEDGYRDEEPVHEQCFELPFWIDVTEVTNAQYGSAWAFSGENRPRESVSWLDAVAHCERRGARLPTEAEWEYAARGPDGLKYPWGGEFERDNLIWDTSETAEVGSRPEGASWVGAMDMSGNVSEWTSSIYKLYPYNAADGREADAGRDGFSRRVMRGGSWDDDLTDILRATARGSPDPSSSFKHWGFRCARSF